MNNLTRISKLLSLRDECQDWGVENADPTRLAEFIEFAELLVPEHPCEFEGIMELVMESYEDLSGTDVVDEALKDRLVKLVRNRATEFPVTLGHWIEEYTAVDWRFMAIVNQATGA